MKSIIFPKDELSHKWMLEWWYFNGHLHDRSGNSYPYMNCLFKADVKKMNFGILGKMPFQDIYFSHSIISDLGKRKSYPFINYFSAVSKDSFTKPLLFINYTNPFVISGYVNSMIEETKPFVYRIRNEQLDLEMKSVKKPLLQGGKGFVNLNTTKTWYYSLTNLSTRGTISIGGKNIKVTGKSWMDHQWSNLNYSKNSWVWICAQLEDGTEITCFEHDDTITKTKMAGISFPDEEQYHTKNLRLEHSGISWKSPETNINYPLSWRIEIPSKKIELHAKPLMKRQEMIFGASSYWEGPLDISGMIGKKKVSGKGFLELVGRPCQYCEINFLRNGIVSMLKNMKLKIRT